MDWLEAESIPLLAALGEKGQIHQQEAERLHSRHQTLSLVELVTPRPKWEQALQSLIHIGENTASSASGRAADSRAHDEQRLIWLLDYDEKHSACSVTPRLQKRTKNGQWTKGRPVPRKTLRANYANVEGLTEQDRRVCSTHLTMHPMPDAGDEGVRVLRKPPRASSWSVLPRSITTSPKPSDEPG